VKKPILLTIDDDPEVLQAISRDLRRAYGESFRIVRVDSGERALDVARQVRLAGDPVALMLVDQRMPGLTGVEFLGEVREFFPDAKRALLTAYADTDVAIRAINDVQIDYYLMKPWDPPEENLFPVLDDLLDDWTATHQPDFDGLRIIGQRWSPESHDIREFLSRNQVPFKWMDIAIDEQAEQLLELAGMKRDDVPVLVFPNGNVLKQPSFSEIAERLGISGQAEVPVYDVIIIGAGPAGLAAAVYAASEGLRTILVERHAAGGQAGTSSLIENYLGFPSGLSGSDLARRALTQARRFGADLMLTRYATALDVHEGSIGVTLDDGSVIGGHSVIIATGVSYRRLDAPGAEELTGRGVYYGSAIVGADAFKDQDAHIVGGGNSAGQAAVYLAERCNSVTMIIRGPSLAASMSQYLVDRITRTENIIIRYHTTIEEVSGEEHIESIRFCNSQTGETETERSDALFVFIGAAAPTEWLKDTLALNERGFILTGPDVLADGRRRPATWTVKREPLLLETSVPGVFAAGDVRHGSGKRVATAVGEGATSIMSVWQYRALNSL
jgi:thioredoxin reductase (NADPH)